MVIHHQDASQVASNDPNMFAGGGSYSEVGLIGSNPGGSTGAGLIASASIVISIDDITEDPTASQYFSLSYAPLNVTIIDTAGNVFPIQAAQSSSLSLIDLLNDSTDYGQQSTSELTQPMMAYPNPSADELTLQFESSRSHMETLKVWNMQGQLMQQTALSTQEGTNTYTIKVGEWVEGLYIVELNGKEGRRMTKVQVGR